MFKRQRSHHPAAAGQGVPWGASLSAFALGRRMEYSGGAVGAVSGFNVLVMVYSGLGGEIFRGRKKSRSTSEAVTDEIPASEPVPCTFPVEEIWIGSFRETVGTMMFAFGV